MRHITFSGEESSRFVRFAQAVLDCNLPLKVRVDGREPLTSRSVRFHGIVRSATLDGYMRLISVVDPGSGIEFWVAGSNSTRSIATRELEFELPDQDFAKLEAHAAATGQYIPGVIPANIPADSIWRHLDTAPNKQSVDTLNFLLTSLSDEDQLIAREAALTLRSFAGTISKRKILQIEAERHLLAALNIVTDIEARIAIVEDLGYIGTQERIKTLTILIGDHQQDDQVRWAAAIALGRIGGEEVVEALISGLDSEHTWSVAAALLGLSRRADARNQDRLEPIFAQYFAVDGVPLLKRYGCLGLSRFETLQETTAIYLVELLGDFTLPIDVKGFAALALSTSLRNLDDVLRSRLESVMDSYERVRVSEQYAPETVWGLEFMAELATLLEMDEVAAVFHETLADSFTDWRSPYYHAMSLYERGEAAIRQGYSEEALGNFDTAIRELRDIHPIDADERASIVFRIDIIQAQCTLQEIIRDWLQSVDAENLTSLARSLDDVIAVYSRYAQPPREVVGLKQLSQRETEYIANTKRLLQVMRVLVRLDSQIRSGQAALNVIGNMVDDVLDSIPHLEYDFGRNLAHSPRELVEKTKERFEKIQVTLAQPNISDAEKMRSLRSLMTELRGLFRKVTWPMPARACPVGGLGRGTLTLLKEDIPGTGEPNDPYEFPVGTATVLNVLVDIENMSRSGSSTIQVICQIAHHELIELIHAVEGPTRCTFVLPSDILSPLASIQCKLSLRFVARDCQQVAATKVVYVRSSNRR